MNITPQIFTLVGVALGAISSYMAASLTDRRRNRQDASARWEARRFEIYMAYLGDVKDQVATANRISASFGLHTRVTSQLTVEDGLPTLANIATRRTVSSERAATLASPKTLQTIWALNDAAWRMECYARNIIEDASTNSWAADFSAYHAALDDFRRCIRLELDMPDAYTSRPTEQDPSKPLGGRFQTPTTRD